MVAPGEARATGGGALKKHLSKCGLGKAAFGGRQTVPPQWRTAGAKD